MVQFWVSKSRVMLTEEMFNPALCRITSACSSSKPVLAPTLPPRDGSDGELHAQDHCLAVDVTSGQQRQQVGVRNGGVTPLLRV
jgi:hypothetical protein